MSDPYGPEDDPVFRRIYEDMGADARTARFLYDLSIVAVNYDQAPEQFEHLVHKWSLTGRDLESAARFIEKTGPSMRAGKFPE